MAAFRNPSFGRMVEKTLKQAASILRDADIPFVLIGSLSAWVRGGPESSHDLDFGIREQDVVRAAQAFEAAGFEIELPPEDWLIKAWHGEIGADESTLVDLIYAPSGVLITDEVFERADEMDVLAYRMLVLSATDLMIMKLLSLREQNLNYTSTIATARAIREQIDWNLLRERCAASPYAEAFFVMAERLGICPAANETQSQVKVLANMQASARPVGETFTHRKELTEAYRQRAQSPDATVRERARRALGLDR